jgi:squalene synthase HpnC
LEPVIEVDKNRLRLPGGTAAAGQGFDTTARKVPRIFLAPKDYVQSEQALGDVYTAVQAEEYTRWLATRHYENFHVVTFLLPKKLHQDFYNVYSFCRWADDLGDEIGDRAESLRLLDWWRQQLHAMYAGETCGHPVFVALQGTARQHALPRSLFDDLITAFEHDQRVSRYQNWDEVFDYCRCSANPVGRLVLRLCGYADDERDRLSDATCTALQLANFWQDVTVDLDKDRVYLPLDLLARHQCPVDDVLARRFSPAFGEAMKEAVGVARGLFHQGLPLIKTVDRRLSFDLDLFSRGGLRILDKIERQGYDVLRARPRISKLERASLLLTSLWSLR